jgi:hypothetical protein
MITANNQTWAEFGNGDILVGSMLCSDVDGTAVGVLTLNNAEEAKEIGTSVPHPEDVDPFAAPIILAFTDIRSLDVVLDHLNYIRTNMKDWEDGKFDDEDAGNETGE